MIFGGTTLGPMGAAADAALAGGAYVTGITLKDAWPEIEHHGCRLIEAPTLHARKALVTELADAFVVLPGGLGTLDELTDVLTLASIGHHTKPMGFLEVDGYWQHLLAWIAHAEAQGFIGASAPHPHYATEPTALLEALLAEVDPRLETSATSSRAAPRRATATRGSGNA
jgi:uncharacterized protein (TIGR00730 family)